MTVYRAKDRSTIGDDGKKKKAYRYDFWYRGTRYVAPRPFPTSREAADAEAELRRRLRRAAAGLEVETARSTMAIADWAEIFMEHLQTRGKAQDLETVEHRLRVVLRFWGRKPDRELEPHEKGPYHDLPLLAPIDEPRHVLEFEDWMTKRGVAGATKNRYRTAMSRLYAIAMRPEFRKETGVTMNPFRAIERDPPRGRTVTLTLEQLRQILAAAPPYLQLAIAIAALAPKLRMSNILALRYDQHLDQALTTITIEKHKTATRTGRPMVSPVSAQLRAILAHARGQQPKALPWVVHLHGEPIGRIQKGLKAVCAAVGVPYGLKTGGATFHTIRHTAASQLAALGVSEHLRKEVMGHETILTTQKYTHLEPRHQVAPLEQLSEALPLADLLGVPKWPSSAASHQNSHQNAAKAARRRRLPVAAKTSNGR